jgi:hypothetical protein
MPGIIPFIKSSSMNPDKNNAVKIPLTDAL